jgi:hypothetical protein
MKVRLGTNDFFGVPFPLVLADRFFHVYPDANGKMKLDVFRWDTAEQAAFYEVEGSKPVQEHIDSNPTGIVTFGEAGGGFLFKFRPKPGVSQIFGRIPISDELVVHIKDRSIRVMHGDQPIVTMGSNEVAGSAIGVQVGADGSVSMGGGALPSGMQLQRGP